ncbi:lysophospholipid acyltransferase family protein [Hydrocarboniclastica marina]|uniref:Lipid A biosynthesis acyltransferase n=1 Tax=Hydrocarboniclastica marina TaxID=2259620 RepID=A0A4P7XEP5_9ALTE|nr:lysophospholipid acyltransferase family protein [Hydrocarboniclastica marina]QCF25023.1 lipid A biosynthesis acyltransferase [Hydrocarboniclastica marina]
MKTIKIQMIRWLLRLLSLLSLPAAQKLGAVAGRIAWRVAGRARQVTRVNIDACFPELTPGERERLARDSLIETAKTALEIPLMWEWPVERCLDTLVEIDGQALLDEAVAAKRGILLLAPHLGNWELAGLYFSSRYKMAALYSPPNVKELESYMSEVRERGGSELVRADRRGLLRLVSILREGGVAGILPDQSPKPAGGVFAPFFGMEILTMKLASKLISKTGCRVLVTYAERLPDGRGFRLVIQSPDTRLFDTDPILSATGLNASVEQCVRAIPAQYQWEYKRFRRRPPGLPNIYKPDRQA